MSATVARAALEVALARPPTLGAGRLIAVDGPAGSGKSTLAAAIFDRCAGSRVVHVDDMYDGWTGLPHLSAQLDTLLLPLADGKRGAYRRYDWDSGRFAETVVVDPVDLLVLEGVGSGSLAHSSLITALVWVHAPREVRLARGRARDGSALEVQWRQWQVDEEAHFGRERTRDRADLVHETG